MTNVPVFVVPTVAATGSTTTFTSVAHGLSNGDKIQFPTDSFTAVWNFMTKLSTYGGPISWTITVVDADHFTIPFNSTGAGAYSNRNATAFTGATATTVLTVSAITAGTITVGQVLTGSGVAGCKIVSQASHGTAAISSGTYDPSTGIISLTMAATNKFVAQGSITLSSLTGTGTNLATLNGTFVVFTASGTAVTMQGPAGQGSITISGGTATAPDGGIGTYNLSLTQSTVGAEAMVTADYLPYAKLPTLQVGSLSPVPICQQAYSLNISTQGWVNNQAPFAPGDFVDGIYDATLGIILCDKNRFYRGVPLEQIVTLCNTYGVHPYLHLPVLADDDYITQAATYLQANMAAGLIPRNEIANEVWNGAYTFTGYFNALSMTLLRC